MLVFESKIERFRYAINKGSDRRNTNKSERVKIHIHKTDNNFSFQLKITLSFYSEFSDTLAAYLETSQNDHESIEKSTQKVSSLPLRTIIKMSMNRMCCQFCLKPPTVEISFRS